MRKVSLYLFFCTLFFSTCSVHDDVNPSPQSTGNSTNVAPELSMPPLSITGKIDCPQRNLTALVVTDYVIELRDSLGQLKMQTKPFPNGKYRFTNLEAGMSYDVRVRRTTPLPAVTFRENQITDYLRNFRPVSELALVAGDVDKNGVVDDTDAFYLQKFMDGATASLPGGTWRMIPSYVLDNSNNINFDAVSPLANMQRSVVNFDLILVVLGDMSLSSCSF